jgi:hypothetical protein
MIMRRAYGTALAPVRMERVLLTRGRDDRSEAEPMPLPCRPEKAATVDAPAGTTSAGGAGRRA